MVSHWALLLVVCHKSFGGLNIFKRKIWKGSSHERTCQVDCGAHFERDWGRTRRIFSQRSLDRLRLTHSKKIVSYRAYDTPRKKGNAPIMRPSKTTAAPRKLMRIVRTSKVPLGEREDGAWRLYCIVVDLELGEQLGEAKMTSSKVDCDYPLKHESLRKRSSHFLGKIWFRCSTVRRHQAVLFTSE